MAGFECLRCGTCCCSYYIVSLPHEVEKQASLLGIPEKDFIRGKMQLYLQLFPAKASGGKINVMAEGIPKKILKKITARLGFRPENFIALPMLCFERRKKGECIFYSSGSGCLIYSARPEECRLFPFISMGKNPDFRKIYGFCKGLQETGAGAIKGQGVCEVTGFKWDYWAAQKHFNETARYLGEARSKGFKEIWKIWPLKGVCLLEGKFLCKISEKDFFGAVMPHQ